MKLDHTPQFGSSSRRAHRCPSGMEAQLTCMDRIQWIKLISWICTVYVPFGTPVSCIFFAFFQLFFRSPTCCEVGRVDLEEGVPKCKEDPGSCQTENIVPKNCWLTWNLKIPLGEGETFPNHQALDPSWQFLGVELVCFFNSNFDVWDIFRNQKWFGWESPKKTSWESRWLRGKSLWAEKNIPQEKHQPPKNQTRVETPFWETSRFFWKQVSGLSSVSKNLSIFNHF